jgi:hypothetical protein
MVTNYSTSRKAFNFLDLGDAVSETLNGCTGTEDERPDSLECLRQVDRLVCSPVFLGSEGLCKLLNYLAHHTLNTPADHLKEYQIATEVFGRPSDFDPQTDSSVRVQIGRLRSKLTQYYDSDGAQDAILVDMPKGRYVLSFKRRILALEAALDPETAGATDSLPLPVNSAAADSRIQRRVIIALAILMGVLLAGDILTRMFHGIARSTSSAVMRSGIDREPKAFQTFWKPFLYGSEGPFVVFSNANFVGTAETGMHYYDPSRDNREEITQHYTGVGEVMGVLELDRLFQQQFGRQFRTKRSGLFTLDDARNNSLIFVGSQVENPTLDKIPNSREFVFRRSIAGPNRGGWVIVDLHPQTAETGIFLPTPQTRPMEVDYAIIALMYGLDRSRWTLILAGTSTVGTEAAVDYVCNQDSLEGLLRRLKATKGTDLKPFEALLRVKVANDVPLETQLVVLRTTD